MAICNEIQGFLLLPVQPSPGVVSSPRCLTGGFSEALPVTAVTSFPRRLVIATTVGKAGGNGSGASAAGRTFEREQAEG